MKLPGFQASASLYGSTNNYRAAAFRQMGGAITLAQDSCTCTSPNCTWSCPTPPTCQAGQTDCGGRCTNLNFDFHNCGACGHVCPENQTCDEGECVCLPPYHYCGSNPGVKCVEERIQCF
jgi:hypothetical protein